MSSPGPALPAPIRASATGGTPKRGYNCPDCLDFTTVVEVEYPADGITAVREHPCHCQAKTVEARP